MYKPFDRVRPACIGSALAVAFSLTLGVGSIPAAAAQSQAQAPCADPRATPEEVVLCVHRLGYQTACTAFTILPETTPADPRPGNDPDNFAW